MRKPLSSIGFMVLLVGLVGSMITPKAQAQKYLAPNYNHCARPFYDPQSYNWYSVENTCSFAIKVVLVAFSGNHGSGALDLGPGRHDGTGETANLVLRAHSQATFEDVEAEIGEAVDYVVHIERQPGRRFIREVLRVVDYDRRSQQFQMEQVFSADAPPAMEVNPC
jgi:hypothetical protein